MRRASRSGPPSGCTVGWQTFAPPGVLVLVAPTARKGFKRGNVTAQCSCAQSSNYPTAAATLRVAHEEVILASPVDPRAWVAGGAWAAFRCSPSSPLGEADPLLWTTPPRPSGTSWPRAWRRTAAGCLRRPWRRATAGTQLEPRIRGSPPPPANRTMVAAIPILPWPHPPRGRRGQVEPRVRLGGRLTSICLTPRTTNNTGTGGMREAIRCRRRSWRSGRCP